MTGSDAQEANAVRESELKYRELVSKLPDIVMRFDRAGRHLFVSDNVRQVVDIPAEAFIGKTHRELDFPEADSQFWEAAIRGVFDSGKAQEHELTLEGKHAQPILNWRLTPEHDAEGRMQAVLCVARDITAQTRAEKNFETLFQEMPDGFALHEIICNDAGHPIDYRFLVVNPAFERMTGLVAADISGKTVKEVLPDIEPCWIETYGKVALTGEPAFFEDYTASLNKHFEVKAFRPAPAQFACIFADVTVRKHREKHLRQSQTMEAVGTLAGGIAHDFNNILGGIIGYTDMCLDHVDKGGDMEADLEEVLKAANRGKLLVRQMLTFTGRDAEQKQVVLLDAIVEDALGLFKISMPSSIAIDLHINKSNGGTLADSTKIHEMLLNLAGNAVHSMNEAGTLTVRLRETDMQAVGLGRIGPIPPGRYSVIEITDTGCGMDEETSAHAFDPFFTTKGSKEGTGMGLSVVSRIVEAHGGNLQVESSLGRGSMFRIWLPISDEAVEALDEDSEPPLDGMERILVVDDEPSIVEVIRRMLTSLGYAVTGVFDGADALKLIEDNIEHFDALITDQIMPGMTGAELAKKARLINPGLPIILCTGYNGGITRERVEALGIKKFLTKPLRRAELAKSLREALDSR